MPSLNSSWPASQSPNLKLSNIVHQLSAQPPSAAFLCHSNSSSSKPFSCLHQSKKRKFKFQCVFAKISVLPKFQYVGFEVYDTDGMKTCNKIQVPLPGRKPS